MIHLFGDYGPVKDGKVSLVTGDQSFDKAVEKRLVDLGVAKYIEDKDNNGVPDVVDKAIEDTVNDLASKTIAELKKIAADLGVKLKARASKSDYINAIKKAKGE